MSRAESSIPPEGAMPLRAETARPALTLAMARRGTVVLGLVLATLVLVVVCARYLALDAYLDHIEGNIAIRGWEYWQGAPVYELQDGVPRFANLYGPLAYLAQVPGLLALGPSVLASKATGVAALVATIVLMAMHLFRGRPTAALHGLFLLVAGLLAFSPASFWTRADPIEAFLVAIGVVASANPITVGPIIIGLCLGLAVNFKIHAFLYFLPIAFDLVRRRGWRPLLPLGLCAAAAFVAPFLLPGVSWHDYLVTLGQQIGRRAHTTEHLVSLLAWLIALSLPLLLPLNCSDAAREARLYVLACLVSLGLLLYPGTFPGAGAYHFLPLLPVLAEARRRLPVGGIGSEFAVFPMLLIGSLLVPYWLNLIAARRDWGSLANEAVVLAQDGPARPAAIGYGASLRGYEIAELAEAKLALAGSPPWIDAQILMELSKIGFDGSRRWVPYVAECRVGRWVVPKDESPFALRNYFYDKETLFDDPFRAAFSAHYRLAAETAHFAAWDCRR